jgi:hypothetical protein
MNHFTLQLLRLLLGLAAVSATAPASAVTSLTPSETRLIHLACHHDVVMLGENSHGGWCDDRVKGEAHSRARSSLRLLCHCIRKWLL